MALDASVFLEEESAVLFLRVGCVIGGALFQRVPEKEVRDRFPFEAGAFPMQFDPTPFGGAQQLDFEQLNAGFQLDLLADDLFGRVAENIPGEHLDAVDADVQLPEQGRIELVLPSRDDLDVSGPSVRGIAAGRLWVYRFARCESQTD